MFRFQESEIAPGDYTIRFSFKLPGKIPSSLMFKAKNREKSKCKVKYFVKAKLNCEDSDYEMKHKQVLAIREEAEELQEGAKISETSELKTWGCCPKGTSSLVAEFN